MPTSLSMRGGSASPLPLSGREWAEASFDSDIDAAPFQRTHRDQEDSYATRAGLPHALFANLPAPPPMRNMQRDNRKTTSRWLTAAAAAAATALDDSDSEEEEWDQRYRLAAWPVTPPHQAQGGGLQPHPLSLPTAAARTTAQLRPQPVQQAQLRTPLPDDPPPFAAPPAAQSSRDGSASPCQRLTPTGASAAAAPAVAAPIAAAAAESPISPQRAQSIDPRAALAAYIAALHTSPSLAPRQPQPQAQPLSQRQYPSVPRDPSISSFPSRSVRGAGGSGGDALPLQETRAAYQQRIWRAESEMELVNRRRLLAAQAFEQESLLHMTALQKKIALKRIQDAEVVDAARRQEVRRQRLAEIERLEQENARADADVPEDAEVHATQHDDEHAHRSTQAQSDRPQAVAHGDAAQSVPPAVADSEGAPVSAAAPASSSMRPDASAFAASSRPFTPPLPTARGTPPEWLGNSTIRSVDRPGLSMDALQSPAPVSRTQPAPSPAAARSKAPAASMVAAGMAAAPSPSSGSDVGEEELAQYRKFVLGTGDRPSLRIPVADHTLPVPVAAPTQRWEQPPHKSHSFSHAPPVAASAGASASAAWLPHSSRTHASHSAASGGDPRQAPAGASFSSAARSKLRSPFPVGATPRSARFQGLRSTPPGSPPLSAEQRRRAAASMSLHETELYPHLAAHLAASAAPSMFTSAAASVPPHSERRMVATRPRADESPLVADPLHSGASTARSVHELDTDMFRSSAHMRMHSHAQVHPVSHEDERSAGSDGGVGDFPPPPPQGIGLVRDHSALVQRIAAEERDWDARLARRLVSDEIVAREAEQSRAAMELVRNAARPDAFAAVQNATRQRVADQAAFERAQIGATIAAAAARASMRTETTRRETAQTREELLEQRLVDEAELRLRAERLAAEQAAFVRSRLERAREADARASVQAADALARERLAQFEAEAQARADADAARAKAALQEAHQLRMAEAAERRAQWQAEKARWNSGSGGGAYAPASTMLEALQSYVAVAEDGATRANASAGAGASHFAGEDVGPAAWASVTSRVGVLLPREALAHLPPVDDAATNPRGSPTAGTGLLSPRESPHLPLRDSAHRARDVEVFRARGVLPSPGGAGSGGVGGGGGSGTDPNASDFVPAFYSALQSELSSLRVAQASLDAQSRALLSERLAASAEAAAAAELNLVARENARAQDALRMQAAREELDSKSPVMQQKQLRQPSSSSFLASEPSVRDSPHDREPASVEESLEAERQQRLSAEQALADKRALLANLDRQLNEKKMQKQQQQQQQRAISAVPTHISSRDDAAPIPATAALPTTTPACASASPSSPTLQAPGAEESKQERSSTYASLARPVAPPPTPATQLSSSSSSEKPTPRSDHSASNAEALSSPAPLASSSSSSSSSAIPPTRVAAPPPTPATDLSVSEGRPTPRIDSAREHAPSSPPSQPPRVSSPPHSPPHASLWEQEELLTEKEPLRSEEEQQEVGRVAAQQTQATTVEDQSSKEAVAPHVDGPSPLVQLRRVGTPDKSAAAGAELSSDDRARLELQQLRGQLQVVSLSSTTIGPSHVLDSPPADFSLLNDSSSAGDAHDGVASPSSAARASLAERFERRVQVEEQRKALLVEARKMQTRASVVLSPPMATAAIEADSTRSVENVAAPDTSSTASTPSAAQSSARASTAAPVTGARSPNASGAASDSDDVSEEEEEANKSRAGAESSELDSPAPVYRPFAGRGVGGPSRARAPLGRAAGAGIFGGSGLGMGLGLGLGMGSLGGAAAGPSKQRAQSQSRPQSNRLRASLLGLDDDDEDDEDEIGQAAPSAHISTAPSSTSRSSATPPAPQASAAAAAPAPADGGDSDFDDLL